jgi:DUF1680 family protein
MRIKIKLWVFFLFTFSLCFGSLQAQEKLYNNGFSLSDVKLLDGPLKHARDLNIEVLLQYDVDRLLAPYRKEAGLVEKAPTYPCWEGLDGHIGGHYLSAMAINYASTGNKECKKRMDYMLSELDECLKANAINNPEWGVGYIGGFPNSAALWSTFKKGDFKIYKSSWAPFYNLHKMYAGLRDAWVYGKNKKAGSLFLEFCDWGIDITSGFSEAQMQEVLNMEHGGMNEVYADAYHITGDKKYLEAAKKYSHHIFLDPLSKGVDNLDNWHANTQIPKFVGFARIAELDGDDIYEKAARFSWETVVNNRTIAFGGNSRREHFPSASSCIDYVNDVDGPETCNTYNMLRLTENLFRMDPSAHYVDYYERALFNHIFSTQHPEHGGYVYFTSARPRHYRVYSTPNNAMWCCVGTGMENHSKYNQFIYSQSGDALYVNLFVASELNWKDKKIRLRQETNFPYEEGTTLRITRGSSNFKLMFRYPEWVKAGALRITLNGEEIQYDASPSSYVVLDRKWRKGDVLKIDLPMHGQIVRLPNVDDYIAFMYGPILLGAKAGEYDLKGLLADDGRWAQYASGKLLPIDQAPILIDDDIQNMGDKLVPVSDNPLHFKLDVKMGNPMDVTLEPFANIHDARYMIYWLALTNGEYKSYKDSLTAIENEKIAIEKRTIDFVATGEQQPEIDHYMKMEHSQSGHTNNESYRAASRGGYFSYRLKTNSETNLSLHVRYWGAERGGRKFEIYVDDEVLVTEDNTGRWNQQQFFNVEYPIPEAMVAGKEYVRVKFQSLPGNIAGGVYFIRLLGNDGTTSQFVKLRNPIIQTKYTADPAPMVYNDTVFLYTSHDEDDAMSFKMKDWLLYTSTDMVNWTDHGAVASLKNFRWAPRDNGAWAPHCVERNGKFYLYCPMPAGVGIGVLVADSPYGPFKDPIGKPLIKNSIADIDPAILIDDDGQAYLYWGNPHLYWVKLNEDMISYSGEIQKDPTTPANYQEGPWVWKRNGYYYLAYASTCCPEGIGYAMSTSPTGKWEYKGMIVDASEKTRGNHPGIIEYKGKSYCFGQSSDLLKRITSRFYERRSVDVDEMRYNADGTIQNRSYWSVEGPEQIGTLNPFVRVEAETIAWSEGVKTHLEDGRIFVTSINHGDYILVKGADFSDGAKSIDVGVSSIEGGNIEIRIDKIDGPVIATIHINSSRESGIWRTFSAPVQKVSGVHDLYFIFKGERDLFHFDWWKFSK